MSQARIRSSSVIPDALYVLQDLAKCAFHIPWSLSVPTSCETQCYQGFSNVIRKSPEGEAS